MAKAAPKPADLNIDLLPKQTLAPTSNEAVHWVLTVGRYLIIFTEIIALGTFLIGIYLSKQKNDLRDSVKSLEANVQTYQNCDPTDQTAFCEDRFLKVQNQINEVATLKDSQFQNNPVFTEFLKLLPTGINLDSLSLDKDTLTFSGTLPSEKELQTLITSFNNSTKITTLDITSVSKQDTGYKFAATAFVNRASFTSGGSQ